MPLLLALALACGGAEPAADDSAAAPWPPPPPEHGVQVRIDDVFLQPGEELERCRPMPAGNTEEAVVTKIELFAGPGLHHAFVAKSPAGLLTEEEECFGFPEAAMEGYNIPEPLFASSTQVEHELIEFPDGVGVPIEAAQELIFDYHLLNWTDAELQAEVYLNLHFAQDPASTEKAGLYVMGNIGDVAIPAGSEASLTTTCPFPKDVDVFSLTPHMHAMGTGFHAERISTGEVLMETDTWDSPASAYFDPVQHFAAGDGMTLTCSWANPTEQDAFFGSTSADEMCFLFGYHWPADGFLFLSEYTGCSVP